MRREASLGETDVKTIKKQAKAAVDVNFEHMKRDGGRMGLGASSG